MRLDSRIAPTVCSLLLADLDETGCCGRVLASTELQQPERRQSAVESGSGAEAFGEVECCAAYRRQSSSRP